MLKKFLSLFNKKEKTKLLIIFLLNSCTFFFELLSLASLPIFVAILLGSNFLNSKFAGTFVESFLQNYSQKELIIITGSLAVAAFVIKNLFLIFCRIFKEHFLKRLKLIYQKIFLIFI